jgi:hypothetical protein
MWEWGFDSPWGCHKENWQKRASFGSVFLRMLSQMFPGSGGFSTTCRSSSCKGRSSAKAENGFANTGRVILSFTTKFSYTRRSSTRLLSFVPCERASASTFGAAMTSRTVARHASSSAIGSDAAVLRSSMCARSVPRRERYSSCPIPPSMAISVSRLSCSCARSRSPRRAA